ncbi:rhomboid-like protein [Kitasatospora sp. NPDC088346]|uniref:rhomboid-like protein n=1 Tax=Kitasatospora sp. NPDC088346 TaxID=3364073 RepID=UPI0038076E16
MAFRRLLHTLRTYPTRSPLTLGYVCVLLLTHAWVGYGMSDEQSSSLLHHVSTNLTNLGDHPVTALLGSTLFFDGTLTDVASLEFPATFITLGLGVCGFLAWSERRWGALRAFAVFLVGHIGATLLTAAVIGLALRRGWYDDSVRNTLDYGISYGAQAVMAASTAALPRLARLPWAAFLLAWPLGGVDWSEPIPDFTTIGHLLAAALGFTLLLTHPERRFPRPTPAPLPSPGRP